MGNFISSSRSLEEADKRPKITILKIERESCGLKNSEEPGTAAVLLLPVDEKKNKNKNEKEAIVLPPEVIMEILSWLPHKPLTRLQLVCKEWRQLIQDHQFKRKHMNRSKQVIYWYNVSSTPAPAPAPAIPSFSYIHGCDGLLLILMRNSTTLRLILWNPAAKLLLQLPDPHNGRCGTALSFAQLTKHYKVVSFFKESSQLGCELLTLGGGPSNQWRRLEFPQDENPNTTRAEVSVVPAGGVPHCVVFTESGEETVAEIASVDVETEILTLNRLPRGVFRDVRAAKAIECDGKLGLAVIDVNKQEMHVMVLQDFKKKRWCRSKEVVPLSFLEDEDFEGKKLVPLLIKEGEIWFLLEKEKVFVYTIETGEIRDEVRNKGITISISSIIYRYKPSMIILEGMRADDELESCRPKSLKALKVD